MSTSGDHKAEKSGEFYLPSFSHSSVIDFRYCQVAVRVRKIERRSVRGPSSDYI